jgi:regulator of protease activity HflC (stomatin/prohibitin superfamily)
MLGIKYLKVPPTTHVIQFRSGRVVRAGAGLSFFYYAPNSVIVEVPIASTDVPFVFNEVTSDYQDATIQGELTYRVADPIRLAALLDYSVGPNGRYRSDDPSKLSDRLIHAAQILARGFTQRLEIGQLLVSSDALVDHMLSGLKVSEVVAMLGVEVLGLSILSIKATPEMQKAFQASAREKMLQRADEAIYARRNTAVELERSIKENELNTEIAVEEKRRTVRETQIRADIAIEQERATLVDSKVENQRKESQAQADALRAMLDPMKEVDWRTLMAAQSGGLDSRQLIALAFRDLADKAESIGNLNISPDLLSSLLSSNDANGKSSPRKPDGDGGGQSTFTTMGR